MTDKPVTERIENCLIMLGTASAMVVDIVQVLLIRKREVTERELRRIAKYIDEIVKAYKCLEGEILDS